MINFCPKCVIFGPDPEDEKKKIQEAFDNMEPINLDIQTMDKLTGLKEEYQQKMTTRADIDAAIAGERAEIIKLIDKAFLCSCARKTRERGHDYKCHVRFLIEAIKARGGE